MKRLAILFMTLAVGGISLGAQAGRQGRLGGTPDVEAVSPAEVQRMFDAYALMQAQDQLQISEGQFSTFLTRYKALQDARRRTLQQRSRVVMELRRLLNQTPGDETQLRDMLKKLQEIDTQGAADEKKAYESIDQVLDIRQQAKFRVFEEVMERRKLELIARARQANRAKVK
jgi:hypothetical protein